MIANFFRSVALTGLMAGASACTNHPSLLGSGGSHDASDGGLDAGIDSGLPDGGSMDAGPPDAGFQACQVRYPIAVLFYDCVDMAPVGGATTQVCLSDEKFGGDEAAARHYVERGMEIVRQLYVDSCTPLVVEPTFFSPGRVLNARAGTPENEFIDWGDDGFLYTTDISRVAADIAAAGDDPYRFGAYVVYNGWRSDILPSYNPATNHLVHRTSPPYSLIGVNLHEGTDPLVPANLKVALRHEVDHTLENIAAANGFTRHIGTHDETAICPDGSDARRICQLFNGNDGNPLTESDWESALGAVGVPVSCEDPAWVAHCETHPTATTCGATECPPLPNHDAACNPQGYCEYSPSAETTPWQAYDRWIYVPAGVSFSMGTADAGADPSELPAHAVTFSRGFFIGKYEVPVEAYDDCVSGDGCGPRSINHWDGDGWGVNEAASRPLHPANAVNVYQALQFCEWLLAGARLASESEWEFAARGPSSLLYPNGAATPTCAGGLAVFNESGTASGFGCGTGGTWPVNAASAGVSPIGAFNMGGNVWEWIAELWHVDYTGAPADGLPWTAGGVHSFYRTIRGGGFNDAASSLRGARRYEFFHTFTNANIGIRCALTAGTPYPNASHP